MDNFHHSNFSANSHSQESFKKLSNDFNEYYDQTKKDSTLKNVGVNHYQEQNMGQKNEFQNMYKNTRLHSVELDIPLKNQTLEANNEQAVGDIFERIQNLRKNLQKDHLSVPTMHTEQQLYQNFPPTFSNSLYEPTKLNESTYLQSSQKFIGSPKTLTEIKFSKPPKEVLIPIIQSVDNPTITSEKEYHDHSRTLSIHHYAQLQQNDYPPQNIYQQQVDSNLHYILRMSEEKIRVEIENKYQSKIEDLEKRVVYLDRSLELIEDMKTKFHVLEGQQKGYNELLMKYNNLLYQYQSSQIDSLGSKKQKLNNEFQEDTLKQESSFYQQNNSTVQMANTTQAKFLDFNNENLNQKNKQNNSNIKSSQKQQQFQIQYLETEEEQLFNTDIDKMRQDIFAKRRSSSGNNIRISRKESPTNNTNNSCSLRNRQKSLNALGTSTRVNHNKENIQVAKKSKKNLDIIGSQKKIQRKTSRGKTNYQNYESKQAIGQLMINKSDEIYHKETIVQLRKKIDKLQGDNTYMKSVIKQLNQRLLSENAQIPLQCCCEELKGLHQSKVQSLEKICEHWKEKTNLLVSKYYNSLQMMRSDQDQLKTQTTEHVLKMKQFVENIVAQIAQRQMEMGVYYEKKLKKYDKENKHMKKRIIQARNKNGILTNSSHRN